MAKTTYFALELGESWMILHDKAFTLEVAVIWTFGLSSRDCCWKWMWASHAMCTTGQDLNYVELTLLGTPLEF